MLRKIKMAKTTAIYTKAEAIYKTKAVYMDLF
jgi:hypothetical protein